MNLDKGMIAVFLLGASMIVCAILLVSHGQNVQEQERRNLDNLVNRQPSYRDQIDASNAAAIKHQEYLAWKTNIFKEMAERSNNEVLIETLSSNIMKSSPR